MGDAARPQCSKLCCHTAFFSSHCPPFPKPRPPSRGEFPSAYGEQISIKPGTVPEERSDAARRVVLFPLILLLGIPPPPSPRRSPALPPKQGKPPLHPELPLGIRAAVLSSTIIIGMPNQLLSLPAMLETPPILPQGATPRAPACAARSRHAESPRADEPMASQKPADGGSRASSLYGQISA